MGEEQRTFLRGFGSESYGLGKFRSQQRGIDRVRKAGTVVDDASVVGIGAMFQIVALAAFVGWLVVALSTRTAREAAGLAKRHTISPPIPAPADIIGGDPHG